MKKMSQSLDNNMLYLATDCVMLHVREPFRIQEEMIEMKNFVPEAFMIHQFQEYVELETECYDCIRIPKSETGVPVFPVKELDHIKLGDDDDEDWDDEDDEDWDEEDDEDWDEEDDEDWDDEDDEDWDEDDEEWDDDIDEDEGQE